MKHPNEDYRGKMGLFLAGILMAIVTVFIQFFNKDKRKRKEPYDTDSHDKMKQKHEEETTW